MAGIGFTLQRLMRRDSYATTLRAYLHAAIISCGPWLITILVIGALGLLQAGNLAWGEMEIFRSTVVYVYAFSLIVTGLLQMPVTRYLADLLFKRDFGMCLPTYAATLIVSGILQSIVAVPVIFAFSGWNVLYAAHAFVFYLAAGFIWIAMIFLSTAKDFRSITFAFLAGGATCLVLSALLGRLHGLDGYLAGFAAGQVLLFALLTRRVAREFPSDLPLSFDVLRYIRLFPALVFIGLFYNVAIWIDKFLFWFGPVGHRIDRVLFASHFYDPPMYLAYLTIVPSLALFLIRVETSFYIHYKNYYGAITGKRSLDEILEVKEAMIASMKLSIGRLLKIQGSLTALALLSAPWILELLRLPPSLLGIFRLGILGAFIHVLLLILTIVLLYFEFRVESLVVVAVFMVSNASFTAATLGMDFSLYGAGYLAAGLVSLLLGLVILDRRMRDLEYITFMQQPVL